MIKGEPGIKGSEKLKSVGLVDNRASLNAANKGTISLLAIVSLKYVGKRNSSFPRVPI